MALFPNDDNARCTRCGRVFTAAELTEMRQIDPYGHRELVRITGTCPKCWDELFPKEEE